MDSTSPAGFLSLTKAAAQAGVSRNTMRDRVRSGAVPSFSDPRNKHFVLIRVADVEGMAIPRPRPVGAPLEAAVGAA